MDRADLRDQVLDWMEHDPDPRSRRELEQLLEESAFGDLADRFAGPLEFGTAGLRGILGAGPRRMNLAVIRRTTAGLASYLKKTIPGAGQRGVVVGFDARRMSSEFAEETARTLAGARIHVHMFRESVPTPLLAFALLHERCAAGIMITASHNPPEYNGYKLYWENGAQIIPPHETGISSAIEAVGPADSIAVATLEQARESSLLRYLGREIETDYLATIRKSALHPEIPKDIGIAYTPLHGTGGGLVLAALSGLGFKNVAVVESQFDPDGEFPTVRYPNPEEKGAMDMVLALARERKAELVLAHDPDGDRLAVAVRQAGGEFLRLTGDQVGALLAHYLLTERAGGPERLVITTVVSSTLLREIAQARGVMYAETLTGFKWIANRAIELERKASADFVLGYEEALGYTIGKAVRDKDGISAAAAFAELAARCRATGKSVPDYLERIYRRYGIFLTRQHSTTLTGAAGAETIRGITARLRHTPPRAVGRCAVAGFSDLLSGIRSFGGETERIGLPHSDVLIFELEGGSRIAVRPSGTEPKIKYYFEHREPVGDDEPYPIALARAEAGLTTLVEDFLELLT